MKSNRTYNQMYNRCQVGNLAANYQLYAHRLARPFENKPPRQTDYNLFVQANYGKGPVFLTREQVVNGACVLAPYQFTRGSLMSIGCEISDGGMLKSDLALGGLVINEGTTVAAFSQALIVNNDDWREGDELSFFHAMQITDTYLVVPRARLYSCHLVLDTTDTELLYNIVNRAGFSSVEGCLGMSQALVSGGAAWVHSRKRADSSIRVSSQRLYVVSELLEGYQSEAALEDAAKSYGVTLTKTVYLPRPSDSQ